MTECHASKCSEPATLRVRFGNNYSFKDRWTSGLDYCDTHGNKVGLSFSDRGLRVLIEDLEAEREATDVVADAPDSAPDDANP